MRPSSIRKTPNIPKKSYQNQERLVLNVENDNKQAIVSSKPKISLSRNKRGSEEDKIKDVYAGLKNIGKIKIGQSEETKQKDVVTNKLKFKFRTNKEAIQIEEKKQELIFGDMRNDSAEKIERISERPTIEVSQAEHVTNIRPKLSLARIKRDPINNQSQPLVLNQNKLRELYKVQKIQQSQSQSIQFHQPKRVQPAPIQIIPSPRVQYKKVDITDLQDRQIDLTQQAKPLNHEKQSKQIQRVSKLNNLINLQMDMYQQMISLQSVTQYQLYISKIKSGAVNNAQDQAFDDRVDKGIQHAVTETFDFGNQTPDDRKITYIRGLQPAKNSSLSLYSFVNKAAAVIEDLLRPTNSFSMPPIYLLSLNPKLVGLYNCPLPISLYKCNDLSLALFGQKLYIARGQITTLLSIGSLLLAGTEQGSILLWSGQKQKSSFYESVKQTLGNSDFQLPSCSSDYLQRQSYFKSSSRIISLNLKISNQFYSLEQFGKLITWSIVSKTDQSKIQYSLQPLNYISLTSMYCNVNLLCRSMLKDPSQQTESDRRQDSFKHRYFITCSKGIVKNLSQPGYPNYFNTYSDVLGMVVTVRGSLIYTVCQDKYLRVYNKSISQPLFQVSIPSNYPLQNILIPFIVIEQGKQLQILAQVYIPNSRGQVFHYHLLQNPNSPKQIIKPEMSQDKNLLKSSVSLNDNKLQFIFITRELRTIHSSQTCNINMTKTPQNFKRIIQQDKRLIQFVNSFI